MTDDSNARFDALLAAMAPPVSGGKRPSTDQALDGERPACCDDTHAPRDISEDASR